MKEIKWTEVLVAEGEENQFFVRVYHSEENAPSFEEVRQEWLDEALTLPHLDITLPKKHITQQSSCYCLTMENYSETFLTLEEAHNEMVKWLRAHSDEFSVNEKARLDPSDSEDLVLDHLVLSYASWCEREGLPHLSMDELICEDITKEQRKQLTAFYLLWEALA